MMTQQDSEIDALIAAHVMGMAECNQWYQANLGSAGGAVMMLNVGLPDENGKRYCPNGHLSGTCYAPDTGWPGSGPRKYSSDDSAVRLVRNRIEELGLVHLWMGHLFELVTPEGEDELPQEQLPTITDVEWRNIQATPRQQCEAALRCVPPTPDAGTEPNTPEAK